jgi:hypothetical protein
MLVGLSEILQNIRRLFGGAEPKDSDGDVVVGELL